jgi:3-(3-hydroxy-phenyl)propionate hydroxylase
MSLLEPGDNVAAMRRHTQRLMEIPAANELVAAEISGLDVCYPRVGEHPLVGRRMPDVDVVTTDGPRRVFELLHAGRPILLDLCGSDDVSADPSAALTSSARYVSAYCPTGQWRLPVLGSVPAPAALLIRPDGYVAWASVGGSSAGAMGAAAWLGARRDA